MLYAHTHTTRTQSYSHTQGTLSPIHFARLRPQRLRDDDPIVLRNRGRSPDENEDTDEDDEDTEDTMSAEEGSAGGASPPAVESQVLDYDPPRARRRSSRGAFTSNAGAQQQPEPILTTSPAPSTVGFTQVPRNER